MTFNWAAIEVAPGSFDFTSTTATCRTARHNITFLPVLVNAPDFYSKKPGTRFAYQPRDNADLARFATLLVQRYGPNGTLWQGNPDLRADRQMADLERAQPQAVLVPRPNAGQYRSMLQTVGAAIKKRGSERGDRDRRPAGQPPERRHPAPALPQALYSGGGPGAFDTVAINSYAVSPKYLGKLMSARKYVNGRGGRSDKLLISEVGWATRATSTASSSGLKGRRSTPARLSLIKKKRKAWKLKRLRVVLLARRSALYQPRLLGQPHGLLTIKGKKKPAYNAFVRGVKRF